MSKKSGFVPGTFNDAGTGETFEGGRDHSFEAGAHANYLAAGLITAPTPRAKPAAGKVARSSKKVSAAKRAAPATAPAPSVADVATA